MGKAFKGEGAYSLDVWNYSMALEVQITIRSAASGSDRNDATPKVVIYKQKKLKEEIGR